MIIWKYWTNYIQTWAPSKGSPSPWLPSSNLKQQITRGKKCNFFVHILARTWFQCLHCLRSIGWRKCQQHPARCWRLSSRWRPLSPRRCLGGTWSPCSSPSSCSIEILQVQSASFAVAKVLRFPASSSLAMPRDTPGLKRGKLLETQLWMVVLEVGGSVVVVHVVSCCFLAAYLHLLKGVG